MHRLAFCAHNLTKDQDR